MTDLPELSRRVSEAQGPSRELDAKVAEAIGWRVSRDPWWNWHEGPRYDPPGDEWCIRRDGRNDLACNEALPAFTASLDAVAALIAEKLPGCGWQIGQTEEDMDFRCWARVLKRSALFAPPNGVAATPALALLSAALLAIHERNKNDE